MASQPFRTPKAEVRMFFSGSAKLIMTAANARRIIKALLLLQAPLSLRLQCTPENSDSISEASAEQ